MHIKTNPSKAESSRKDEEEKREIAEQRRISAEEGGLKMKESSSKPGYSKSRRWKPLVIWQVVLPTILTIS